MNVLELVLLILMFCVDYSIMGSCTSEVILKNSTIQSLRKIFNQKNLILFPYIGAFSTFSAYS